MSLLDRFRQGLARTRGLLAGSMRALFSIGRRIDAAYLEELEETLILADVGPDTARSLCEDLQRAYKAGEVADASAARDYLKARIASDLAQSRGGVREATSGPTVILVVGVNGSGKTTSIAKMAHTFRVQGKRVLLAAGDTFRAAACEQLAVWSERVGAEIVRHQQGGDPAAVAFDAAEAAVARGVDVLIVDTAGRLHTQEHLMRELGKIRNVVRKKIPDAPHEVLLVLDATAGQNAIQQARQFQSAVDVTGIFLAKLDGTAKGGIVVAIRRQLDIPVKFVGVGEGPEDVAQFDPVSFAEALFS